MRKHFFYLELIQEIRMDWTCLNYIVDNYKFNNKIIGKLSSFKNKITKLIKFIVNISVYQGLISVGIMNFISSTEHL